MKQFKIIVEKHPDTYVAYPLGLKGVVVGQGDTYEAALADTKSAIQFHIETFGRKRWKWTESVLEVFIAEAGVSSDGEIPCGCTHPGSDQSCWKGLDSAWSEKATILRWCGRILTALALH